MGTGGKPGFTIKTEVISKTKDELVLSLKNDESDYFQISHDYVAQFTPAPASGEPGSQPDEGNPA